MHDSQLYAVNNQKSIENDSMGVFRYNSFDYTSEKNHFESHEPIEPMELLPMFVETLTEYSAPEARACLVVNLEDLVNEEYYINQISEVLKKSNKHMVYKLCQNWWKVTDKSSVKDMQVFFEENLSKKLIKTQQILL